MGQITRWWSKDYKEVDGYSSVSGYLRSIGMAETASKISNLWHIGKKALKVCKDNDIDYYLLMGNRNEDGEHPNNPPARRYPHSVLKPLVKPYLKKELKDIDKKIADKTEQIEKLRQRKQNLEGIDL